MPRFVQIGRTLVNLDTARERTGFETVITLKGEDARKIREALEPFIVRAWPGPGTGPEAKEVGPRAL